MWDHLKFTMKRQTRLHQTRLLWTGPCRAKPRHVSPSANKRENTAWLNLTDTTFTKKNPTRCNNVSKFYYSIFICSSKCCRWHTAHHEDPKTALAASGFSYVEGCWTCSWWMLSGILCLTMSTNYTSSSISRIKKPEAANAISCSWWWAVCRPKHVELHINKE